MPNNAETIDKLIDKISTLFSGTPASASSIKDELRTNLRALIQNALTKLDVVSRDEFEAQVAVLQRSREKIDALEQQMAALLEQQQD